MSPPEAPGEVRRLRAHGKRGVTEGAGRVSLPGAGRPFVPGAGRRARGSGTHSSGRRRAGLAAK